MIQLRIINSDIAYNLVIWIIIQSQTQVYFITPYIFHHSASLERGEFSVSE